MAEGALKRSQADIALARDRLRRARRTGSEEGLVHFALARRGKATPSIAKSISARGGAGLRVKSLKVHARHA